MLSPEAEVVTEGDLGVKSLCLSISNTTIDLNVTFRDDPILTGKHTCSGKIKFWDESLSNLLWKMFTNAYLVRMLHCYRKRL